jgi:hypothetical protein
MIASVTSRHTAFRDGLRSRPASQERLSLASSSRRTSLTITSATASRSQGAAASVAQLCVAQRHSPHIHTSRRLIMATAGQGQTEAVATLGGGCFWCAPSEMSAVHQPCPRPRVSLHARATCAPCWKTARARTVSITTLTRVAGSEMQFSRLQIACHACVEQLAPQISTN